MTKSKQTKRALFSSSLALVLCFTMLLGTTFAWFTDTDTASVNKIQAGNLKIAIVDANDNDLTEALAFKNDDGETRILWEPGATFQTDEFYIKNKGNLHLTYKIEINNTEVSYNKLNEVIGFCLVDADGNQFDLSREFDLAPDRKSGALRIQGTMSPDADNAYQGLSLDGVAITVYAKQNTVEKDYKDNQYDKDALYDDEIVTVSNADEFIAAFANLEQDQIITLTGDIDMTGKNWTPIRNMGFTLNGNGKTVKGLNGPLVATTAAQDYTIKNITFDGLTIDNLNNDLQTTSLRCAALIAYADTCAYIMMDNVTIKNADIRSADYAAGFAAYTSGYGVDNNGPVNASHNFNNCKLVDSTIQGNGSTGGLIGHAGSNNATTTRIKDFTLEGTNTIKCMGDDGNTFTAKKTGNIIGTANIGTVYIEGTSITADDIGRFKPQGIGKLYINNVEQDEQEPFTNVKTN